MALTVSIMSQEFKGGDHMEWYSEASRVRGRIIEVLTSSMKFKGYTIHAGEKAPQAMIKSDKIDHIAMHQGSALKKIA